MEEPYDRRGEADGGGPASPLRRRPLKNGRSSSGGGHRPSQRQPQRFLPELVNALPQRRHSSDDGGALREAFDELTQASCIYSLQEHWLPPPYKKYPGVNKLKSIHPNLDGWGRSAMKSQMEQELMAYPFP